MTKMEAKRIFFLLTFMMLFIAFTSARLVKHGCPLLCNCNQTKIGIEVRCQTNLIKEIPKIAVNATDIYIQSKNLIKISKHAFDSAGNFISVLNLANCQINTIEQDAFFGMKKTTSLSLVNNELKKLPSVILQPLLDLEIVFLGYNKLVNFDGLCVTRKLEKIHLEANKLLSIKLHPCFNLSHSLYYLNFEGNNIGTIVNDDFYSVRNIGISELYLNDCNLTTIQNDTFMYLPTLKNLGLNNNHLSYLPVDVFKWQGDLTQLDLSNNKFHVPPMESLRPLLKLNELLIGGNKQIKNLTLGPVFRSFKDLSRLSLSKQNLSRLTNDTFKYLNKCPIQEIVLTDCSIREIEPEAFAPISTYLEKIDINSNPIDAPALSSALYGLRNVSFAYLNFDNLHLKDLDQSTFRHLRNVNQLKKMSIDSSEIAVLRKNVLPPINHLNTLSFANNGLKIIEYGSLDSISFVETLILTRNDIDQFPTIKNGQLPTNLKSLWLDNNNIKSLFAQLFIGLENLESLHLRKALSQLLHKLGSGCWESLKSLRLLDLRDNNLGSLFSFSGNLPNTLRYLFLGGNPIQNYSQVDFSNIYNLEELDLSKQGGSKLENMLLVIKRLLLPLFRLMHLNIGTLGLTHLDVETFKNNTELVNIKFDNNRIQTWNPKLFIPLKKLQFLSLANNDIFYITKESFQHLPSLLKLDLSRNLFHCDCNLEWFRNVFIFKDNLFIANLQNEKAYTCTTPSNLHNEPILDFHISEHDCQTKALLILVITVLSTFVGITFVISVVLRYRWYIRYWVYLLRVRRKQYFQLDQDKNFLYDAFVSYNSKDSRWVIQKLLPALEYNGEFRICLYDRDWVVGANIAECVIESIENSRKTILILSDNFAKSEWCQFELSLAHHKLLSDKIDVLVPILFSEIEDKNMTASMRGLLTQKIYLEWPQDKAKEERFWKGLKTALQRPQRRAVRR